MKITTAANEIADTRLAIEAMVHALELRLTEKPVILKASYTEHHDPNIILAGLQAAFPDTQILGGSTHEGLFTEQRTFGFGKPAIGALTICDDDTDVGVAVEALPENASNDDITAALSIALERAEMQADRLGELPDLI
ncbi:hypothetical protein [Algirhabdus cladophorae]|uniref:hypothetical protein n=1 Tax=Algirhabdus cladophorae TaxID=3377108 RepID=UPI003B84991F